MKKTIIIVIALIAFTSLGVYDRIHGKNKLELQKVQLQSKQSEIKQLQIDYKVLDKKQTEVQQKHDANQAEVDRLNKEKEDLLKRQQELEQQVSIKREQQRLAAERTQSAAALTSKVSAAPAGNCASWLAQAGVTDLANANELIRRESGCNPGAVNKSSGACGIAQELPCGKSGCSRGDGACQVRWMDNYVKSRYGSWAAAVSHHNRMNWY